MSWPLLNWKEIALLTKKIRPEVKDLFVERIIIPERPLFPEGYLKGEWVLRLTGRRSELFLYMSIRPRHPAIACLSGRGPKASTSATRSPFDLSLSKSLKGARLLDLESIPKERTVIFWFSNEARPDCPLGLVLTLIPTSPEALLIEKVSSDEPGWPILARSRTIRDPAKLTTHFIPPDGLRAPANIETDRAKLFESLTDWAKYLEGELAEEAFELRCQRVQRSVNALIKQVRDRIRQSQTAIQEASKEKDWQKWGDLLKGSLWTLPGIPSGAPYTVTDYMTGEPVNIPSDPQLTPQEQIAKFYYLAKRKSRRITEAQSRLDQFQETLLRLQQVQDHRPETGNWPTLERAEALAQITHTPTAGPQKIRSKGTKWLGKSFVSQEGLLIYAGRSKQENLELTFKTARGNDIWMHVRGKPGAHIVIPVQPGKSVSLETLLDGANLAIHYSGGSDWGTTEVDYTFKKHVKRIKDSSEASYTHNKTLMIQPDPSRLKRLLHQP